MSQYWGKWSEIATEEQKWVDDKVAIRKKTSLESGTAARKQKWLEATIIVTAKMVITQQGNVSGGDLRL